jgi:[protein-PII] uridylyltransferase
MTIRTALLDSRLVTGNAMLFADLMRRFREEIATGTARQFVDAKLAERAERHRRTGESRYRVEPNVKDGKGGLRDLHTLHWLVRYTYGREPGVAGEAGLFTPSEFRSYRHCEDFLWTVRCHLHFLAGRPEERLTFDVQPILAERLHYNDRGGLLAVERFMKHYFLVAREVGELTLAASAALELKQVKSAPVLGLLLAPLSWRTRAKLRRTSDFRIENGRLTTAKLDVFRLDPVNILRIFQRAEEHGVQLHPDAVRLLRQSRGLLDDRLRADPEANRIFLELLTHAPFAEQTLRSMNETGVLGRFIPDFGRVVAMMQFNMYHHFTVDEHSIRAVGVLAEIDQGTLREDHPVSTRIIREVQNLRALYVAVLLHDVGKRLPGDHSETGGKIARNLGPRLGLSRQVTETTAWLIEHHLVMSIFAQSRDLSDPKTIRDFADIVQSLERLRLLLILTVADIRAVGPGVWNGWKGQLLRTLYYETETVLSGGHARLGQSERLAEAQARLRKKLTGWQDTEIDRVIARIPADLWLRIDDERLADRARLLARAASQSKLLAWEARTDAFTAVTELTVLAPNVPRLLAMFAGACASAGADIMGAQVSTTTDDFALDTFLLKREHGEEDELRLANRIGETIGRLLEGKQELEELLVRRKRSPRRAAAFSIEPEVLINNGISDRFTVIELSGLDRPGLLSDITIALSDLELDITSAQIATYGERAVDVFYVTGPGGERITEANAAKTIRKRLTAVLAGNAVHAAVAPA